MKQGPRLTHATLKVLSVFLFAGHDERSGADIAASTKLASGTLYPILLRCEQAGWLKSRWEEVDPREAGRPRRRLYRITAVGAAQTKSAISDIVPKGAVSWA
jgi:PadR family transcriptional regulator PadR